MKFLITGAGGMLAEDIRRALTAEGEEIVTLSQLELDITDRDSVLRAIEQHRPEVVVNAAAFTNVDNCETEEAMATAVNGTAVGHLSEGANRVGALLVHISTDFVFNGTSDTPYEVDQPVAPLSAYGRSKLAGEVEAKRAEKHLIIRTSWLFGTDGWNFVEAIRKQIGLGKSELKVVNDQRGKPTYTPHLSSAIVRLAKIAARSEDARGIFHYADDPECSWFDFATEIVRQLEQAGRLQQAVRVLPCTTDEFPRPARRPAYSVLSTKRYEEVTGRKAESWVDGLAEYLKMK